LSESHEQEIDNLPRYNIHRENEGRFEAVRLSKARSIVKRADNELEAYKRVVALFGETLELLAAYSVSDENFDAISMRAIASLAFVELTGFECSDGWTKSARSSKIKELWHKDEDLQDGTVGDASQRPQRSETRR